MKQIINNKEYDTEKAKVIRSWSIEIGIDKDNPVYEKEVLYKKNNGEFFFYCWGKDDTIHSFLIPPYYIGKNGILHHMVQEEEAIEWAMELLDGELFESIYGSGLIFGEVPCSEEEEEEEKEEAIKWAIESRDGDLFESIVGEKPFWEEEEEE